MALLSDPRLETVLTMLVRNNGELIMDEEDVYQEYWKCVYCGAQEEKWGHDGDSTATRLAVKHGEDCIITLAQQILDESRRQDDAVLAHFERGGK